MAQTKVKLVSNGVVTVDNLHTDHGITTDHVAEGSVLYYTDARVSNYLTTNNYATEAYVSTTTTNSANWDTAYSWGDHSLVGYLTSFTETDPIYTASSWYTTTNNAANWDTAFGWGNHASQGYATQTYVNTAVAGLVDAAPATLDTLNELAAALGDDPNFATTVSTSIGTKWTQDNTKISNWDTAFGWGNHASAGYQPASTAITTSNIGSQSVSNASTAGGLSVHGGRNYEANKIVRTDVNGYIQAGWINTTSGAFSTGIDRIYCSSDDYIRYQTPANFIANLGLITTSNIGSQSVSYATSAGNASTANGANGNFYVDDNYGNTVVGVYTSTRYQGVWAMGDAYKLPADGTSTGSLYGLAWSHPNAGGVAGNLNTHGLLVTENGSFLAAVSGSIRSRDDMRSPIFYDSNNTGYYVDPTGRTNLSTITVNGGTNYFYGITYFETNNGGYLGSTDSAKLQAYSSSNNSAFMSFHKGGHYAVNMGLDADNVFRIGGWSASANRFQMDMSGNLTMAGDVTAYSDARVKENVVTIDNALDKVKKVRGVYYNRTDSEDKKTKIGVIAQELLEIIPEVVNQDNDGMYNVSYGNIAALLIEAIKEQQQQIDELKSLLNK